MNTLQKRTEIKQSQLQPYNPCYRPVTLTYRRYKTVAYTSYTILLDRKGACLWCITLECRHLE
jgi:hypothetical protein